MDLANYLRQRIEANKLVLAEASDMEIARVCLVEIAKDQAELDLIERTNVIGKEITESNCRLPSNMALLVTGKIDG